MPCCQPIPEQNAADSTFRRILWLALLINAVMFCIELGFSQIAQSTALLADSLDFLGDAANYAISLVVIGAAVTVRAKASLIKGSSMALLGIWVLGSALYRVFSGSEPNASIMGSIAMLAFVANLSVAISLYRYRVGDSNMRSIWLCSRNDAIGNIAVLIAALGVFGTATRWPDLIVASIIALLALSSSYQVIRLARQEIKMGVASHVAGNAVSHHDHEG